MVTLSTKEVSLAIAAVRGLISIVELEYDSNSEADKVGLTEEMSELVELYRKLYTGLTGKELQK